MAARQNLICDFRPILPLQGMLNDVPLCTLEEAVAGNGGVCLASCDAAALSLAAGVTIPPRFQLVSLCAAALEMAEYSPLSKLIPSQVLGIDRLNLVAAIILYTMEDPFPFYRLVTQPLNVNGIRLKAQLINQLPYLKLLTVALRYVPRDSEYWSEKVLYRGVNIEGIPSLQEKYDHFETAFAPGVKMTFSAPTSTSTNSKVAGNFTKGIQAKFIVFTFISS